MVSGRFSIEDFSDWLSLNATQIRYGLDIVMTERMVALLVSAGFKRGLDAAHLQHSLSEDDVDYRYSFKFALDRLALGIAVPEHTIFENTLSFSQVQTGDFELVAKLIEIYYHFASRRDWLIMHEKGQRKPVEQWLDILKAEIEEFTQAGVDALQAVYKIVRKQYTMLTLSYNYEMNKSKDGAQDNTSQHELYDIQLPLPYLLQEIQSSLESQLDQALPTGQITFSQIGHIRPLPYKLIVVLNLDSGKFPNRNTQVPFDLMSLLRPQLGDRSRLEDDQGAFLDALLLAQENLWLFYNGFDVSDGEVREPSSVLQELIQHFALITGSQHRHADVEASDADHSTSSSDTQLGQMVNIDGIDVPEQISQLYHVHALQPFDPKGFESEQKIRYQDQWFDVAQHIIHASGQRQAWIDSSYPVVQDDLIVLDAGQWIQDMTFPARLYLKTLGVDNLKPEDIPAQEEPLVLDGLGRYAIRDFLQHQEDTDFDSRILQDRLPVGKVQHSALQISIAEQQRLQQRLLHYAPERTLTTQRQWHLNTHVLMNITVPKQAVMQWVSLDASSARAKRRTKIWLEYLLWIDYLNLSDDQAAKLQRIAIFSDATLINSGVTTTQAKDYLLRWFKAYQYGQTQPLVLPAALLLQLAEKGKALEWQSDEMGKATIANFTDLRKEWDKSDSFLPFSLADMEWSRRHRDWQFILDEQDTTALLKHCCDAFAYDLYQPIYHYQIAVED